MEAIFPRASMGQHISRVISNKLSKSERLDVAWIKEFFLHP